MCSQSRPTVCAHFDHEMTTPARTSLCEVKGSRNHSPVVGTVLIRIVDPVELTRVCCTRHQKIHFDARPDCGITRGAKVNVLVCAAHRMQALSHAYVVETEACWQLKQSRLRLVCI